MALQWRKTRCPLDTRKKIVFLFLDGENIQNIAARFFLKERTIKEYLDRYFNTGSVESEYEKTAKNGAVQRNKLLSDTQTTDYLLNQCEIHPTTSLDRYVGKIHSEFGVYVSRSTIDRFFQDKDYSWKKISKLALESDPIEESEFSALIKTIVTDKKQLSFGHESHRNDCTSNPRYARGPKCSAFCTFLTNCCTSKCE